MTYLIELFVIPGITWNHLTAYKQMTHFDWIASHTSQYLEPFNSVQTNEKFQIEWLVLNSNICNHYSVWKWIVNIII